MSHLSIALYMVAGACLTMAALTGNVWLRRREMASYGLFALACIAVAGNALWDSQLYSAGSVSAYVQALRWAIFSIIFFLISLTWFVVAHTGAARRWLAWTITGILALDAAINLVAPFTLVYTGIDGLGTATLLWGESITVAVGSTSLLRWSLVQAPGVLLTILVVDSLQRQWRQGSREHAISLGGSFLVFLLLYVVYEPLVDVGLLRNPYVTSFSFMIVITWVGLGLSSEVVRASVLSREVVANELRWRSLLEGVQLMVIGVDADGRIEYSNPFFESVTGYAEDDVRGRSITSLFREGTALYPGAHAGEAPEHTEEVFTTKDGVERRVLWSTVDLFDSSGTLCGAVGIGADLTDRVEAEEARDQALAELKRLKDRLAEENLYLRAEVLSSHGFEEMIGESDALRYVLHRVEQVAGTDATVLIEGETGVGKELVARAVHTKSGRTEAAFIKVNCAALPANLIESELFGHERGAFTGANQMRRGRFELADGGTLLLDEVAELPIELQVRLLRVLQDGTFERVGSSRTRTVDVRIIAATNRGLKGEVDAGRFREDLFYRLNVYPISVPPLRERTEDIPLLVAHFVRHYAERSGKEVSEISPSTLRRLNEYPWPGNVRELQNVLERAVITSVGSVLEIDSLAAPATVPEAGSASHSSVLRSLVEVERSHILAVLRSTRGRVAGAGGAAGVLGIHPSTLRSRMNKLGIDQAEYKKTPSPRP